MTRRTLRSIVPALVAVLFLAVGCQSQTRKSPPASPVTDDLGRTVMVPDRVSRVVTLAPNITEIVFAAGAGEKLVGASTADTYPPAIESLPRFSILPIDFEAIIALNPDLVLATDQVNTLNDAATFAALGIPVFFFSYNSLDEMLASVRTAGTLLGTTPAATATVDTLEASIKALRTLTDTLSEKPSTLFIIGDETLYAFGRGNYIHDVIALAGGLSMTADMESRAPVLSDEYVLTQKPAVIVGAFGEDYDPAKLLALHPTWDVVPAIQNGRVYSMNPDHFLRPTPRLIEGAWAMAAKLHPTLFPQAE